MLDASVNQTSSGYAMRDTAGVGQVSFVKPVSTPTPAKLSPHEILMQVCEKHDVDMADLKGRNRRRQWSRARSEACFRLRSETDLQWDDIADVMHMSDNSSARWHFKNWTKVKEKPLYVSDYYYYGSRAGA